MDNFAKCGLLVNDISNHLPIFAILFDTSVDTLDNRRPLMYIVKRALVISRNLKMN